jgi:cellulose synthase/poly-beta-1,6-N-acetylglucosamine synthase-like glycosyltransferase
MMTAVLVIDALVALLWLIVCVSLPFTLRHMPRARTDAPTPAGDPRVSVIIPARDEELLLPRCLRSVRAQDVPVHEIIVVDDDSNDATARLAVDGGARVVPAGARPDGWAGKTWAAQSGSKEATGDWLLFLDADAVLAPGCVRTALSEAEEHGADLLSLLPRPTCSTLLEAVGQPLFMLASMLSLNIRTVNDPKSRAAAAWGGFLLFRRRSYDALGGFAVVRNEVIEDLMLARAVKGRKMRLRLLSAPELVEAARPQSFRKLWDAACRLTMGAMPRSVFLPLLFAVWVIGWFVGPYLLAPLGGVFLAIAAIHLACVLALRMQLARACALDSRFALLQPLAALGLAAVLVRASVGALSKDTVIRWRRRQYPG